MKRFGWRAWLGVLAIFVLGAVVGGSAAAWVGGKLIRERLNAPASAPGAADRTAARIAAELSATLELTPELSARVQQLLDESAANMKDIRARAVQEARREVRASARRIAAELPAEERAEFYRIIGRRFERLGMPSPVGEE